MLKKTMLIASTIRNIGAFGWVLIVSIALFGAALAASFLISTDSAGKPSISMPFGQSTGPNVAPPEPEVFKFQDVEPQKAVELNAAVPVSNEPIYPAAPFVFNIAGTTAITRLNAVDCLTSAVYYEAGSENSAGQSAVAQVVLNRVRHPAYPNSVCGVVFQGSERSTGCQFTFTCDGSLGRIPNSAGWQRARRVAEQALAGYVQRSVGLATHYHTIWVLPYWQKSLTKVITLDAHIFYRWQGPNGRPAAFRSPYAGAEIQPAKLASLTGFLVAEAALAGETALPVAAETSGLASTQAVEAPPSPLPPKRELAADHAAAKPVADETRGTLLIK